MDWIPGMEAPYTTTISGQWVRCSTNQNVPWRGTNASLYLAEGFGLADEASSDAMPDTACGELVTGPLDRMA